MMKRIYTLSAAFMIAAAVSAQTVDTVSTTAGYAQDVFYSLPNGIVKSEPKENWDLAFQIGGQTDFSILANTQGIGRVYQSPLATAAGSWDPATAPALTAIDTTDLTAVWQRLDNDPTNWDLGALSINSEAGGVWQDVGWGYYDMQGDITGETHLTYGDSIFVIKTAAGNWKQFYINKFKNGQYIFTYADLDGSNQVTDTLAKGDYTGKNFAYYSLDNSTALDREPLSTNWNLLFTKYITFDYPGAEGTPQSVTGVLTNTKTEAVKAYPVDVTSDDFSTLTFSADKNIIGHAWKSLNYETFQYDVADSTVYYVTNAVNTDTTNIYKIVFLEFGGTANGNYIFSKKLVGSVVATGINDLAANFTALDIYPNPAQNNVNVVYNYTDNKPLNTVVNVYDLSGRLSLQQTIEVKNGLNKETLNISSLERGVYIVTFPELGNKAQKLIVQ